MEVEVVHRTGPIDLSRADPVRLGDLEISPATRQMARGDRRETLEPRVMQVFVALSRANGAVVSRDDLIATCWDGRVVGDNAIHRVISRLREVETGIGRDCFRIETVSKVGYRLIALDAAKTGDAALPRATAKTRRGFAPLGLVLAALAIAAGAIWLNSPGRAVTTIAVTGTGGASAELAGSIAADLSQLSTARNNSVAFAAGSTDRADYELRIAMGGAGPFLQTDASLFRAASPQVVWSARITGIADPGVLRQRIVYDASEAIACALGTQASADRTDADLLRVRFAACGKLGEVPDEQTLNAWRHVVAKAPDDAPALATLAYVEAVSGDPQLGTTAIASTHAAAREHLEAARRMNPKLGLTYAAESILVSQPRFAEKLAIIDRGLALDPDCATLYAVKSLYLRGIGRLSAAIDNARTAVVHDPGSPVLRENLLSSLGYGGFAEEARSEIRADRRIWPDSRILREGEFRFEFRFGDAAKLLTEIDRGKAMPNSPWVYQNSWERAFLQARANPTAENIDKAAALAVKYHNPPGGALQTLVALGLVDRAYALMADRQHIDGLRDTGLEVPFRANMRPFVLDRRFMALADRLGLVAFWMSSNLWPDFCEDKDVPYNCKAEALRVHPRPVKP